MAIPGIEGLVGLTSAQMQPVAVRKTDASADSQGAIAPNKTAAGAPRGAGGPPAGGTGKSSGAAGSTSSSQSTSYDKMDTNQDGVVSAFEKLTYNMKHPEASTGSLLDVRA